MLFGFISVSVSNSGDFDFHVCKRLISEAYSVLIYYGTFYSKTTFIAFLSLAQVIVKEQF